MKKINQAMGMVMLLALTIFLTACQKDAHLPEFEETPQYFMMEPAGDYFSYSELEACLGNEVTVHFNNGYSNDCGNIQIQMWGPDDDGWVQVFGPSDEWENGLAIYTFTPESEGSYAFRGQYTRTGSPSTCPNESISWTEAAFDLEVISCLACTDEFDVQLDCDETSTLTVSFSPAEAGTYVIQGGLTNGTTIVSASSNNSNIVQNTDHPSVTNSSSNVTRWEGDLDACEEVVITITFTGGNGVGSWSAKSSPDGEHGDADSIECN